MLSTQVPFLGICMGMQCAVIEYSRSKLGFADANSEEMNPKTSHPVVVFMPEITKDAMGGTMRLGARVRDWQRKYAVTISESTDVLCGVVSTVRVLLACPWVGFCTCVRSLVC